MTKYWFYSERICFTHEILSSSVQLDYSIRRVVRIVPSVEQIYKLMWLIHDWALFIRAPDSLSAVQLIESFLIQLTEVIQCTHFERWVFNMKSHKKYHFNFTFNGISVWSKENMYDSHIKSHAIRANSFATKCHRIGHLIYIQSKWALVIHRLTHVQHEHFTG